MSDAVTLIAGILLTSVGLIALSPFVVRLVRSGSSAFAYGTGRLLPALADGDTALPPPFASGPDVTQSVEEPASIDGSHNLEELMAQLFGLRMIVSDVTADVQAVHDVLAGAEPEQEAEIHLFALDNDSEEYVA